MLLSARILNDVTTVNSFTYGQVHQMSQGEASDVYIQLIDANKNPPTEYFYPFGLRYVPASGATLQVQLASVDDGKTITRYASQPFPGDPSIWKLSLLATDPLVGTFAMKLTLNEGGSVKKGSLQQAVQIAGSTQSFC